MQHISNYVNYFMYRYNKHYKKDMCVVWDPVIFTPIQRWAKLCPKIINYYLLCLILVTVTLVTYIVRTVMWHLNIPMTLLQLTYIPRSVYSYTNIVLSVTLLSCILRTVTSPTPTSSSPPPEVGGSLGQALGTHCYPMFIIFSNTKYFEMFTKYLSKILMRNPVFPMPNVIG